LEVIESLGQGLLTLFRGVMRLFFPRHGHKGKRNWLKGEVVRGKYT
jgi:hypothetical protein